MKGLIYCIGGGEIANRETYELDKHLVSLANKDRPHFLFVPTASHDDQSYTDSARRMYEELGCEFEGLFLYDDPSKASIKKLIDWADIIYVGGGFTNELLLMWTCYGIAPLLKKAAAKGAILAGLSAGSNCWFEKAYCYDQNHQPDRSGFSWLEGLAFLPFATSPHYEEENRTSFDSELKSLNIPGFAIDSGVALIFIDGEFVGNWKAWGWDDHHAYRITYKNDEEIKEEIA